MEVGIGSTLLPGDPCLIDHIVGEVKSQGIFDQFRKECIADVDTKPAYQNLRTRVESSVNTFLCKQVWKPDMNKNQLRENLRKHIHDAAYLDMGVERIVDQVVNPKVYSVFMPQIEDVVYKFLGIERPKERERNGTKSLKDLLPKDLDPVSPESDKNSLKDVSLESVDTSMNDNVNRSDNSPPKDFSKIETNTQSSDNIHTKTGDDDSLWNRKMLDGSDNQLECYQKNSSKNVSTSNLDTSGKSDEKIEDEEEDSPMFEPIDIMNFNESNDSHLSGISELTSHRSRSPDFSNDFSRDNLDFSNHDSQLSKVSSDSRLSIVTDFGLSNHASTPIPTMEVSKEESNRGKSVDSFDPKSSKDNFKAIRDIEPNKINTKEAKNVFETIRSKDNAQQQRDSKDSKATKTTPDLTQSTVKDNKNDCKDLKEQHKDNDKRKSNKEKGYIKESKPHKEREKDHRKKQTSHSSLKHEKIDKNLKDKSKDKSEKSRDNSEKFKEYLDKSKEVDKPREDKKDSDKKDISTGKDLKDIYKEKIRELREKKELTEKEKLAKDPRESKSYKDSTDKKDSSRDRKDSKTSTLKSSSRHDDKSNKNDEKSVSKNDNKSTNSKSSGKGVESKDLKNDSKDKVKREDKRQSKDSKESRSKMLWRSHSNNQKNYSMERSEKSDMKKDVKNDSQSKESERSERSDAKRDNKMETQKSELNKDLKTESQSKECERNEKSDAKKDSKTDSQSKDKKKKPNKKSKAKDDHSSLRKNPNDRRSTDRDGSNGSSSRSSQKSNSSSIANTGKTGSTNLTKESSGTSNSSSETSDNIDVLTSDEIKLSNESTCKDMENTNKVKPLRIKRTNENESEPDYYIESQLTPKRVDLGQTELSLPLKKRPLQGDSGAPNPNDFKVKKPKFAKNFQEAKKLMKIRKKLEKQRLKEYEAAKEKFQMANNQNSHNSNPSPVTDNNEKTAMLPDEERVQIIEVTDDEYEEPYPDLSMKEIHINLGRQSLMSLENPLVLKPQENLDKIFEKRSTLSAMEESIRESLEDMISDKKLLESKTLVENQDESAACVKIAEYNALATMVRDIVDAPKNCDKLFPFEMVINNMKNTNCVKANVSSYDTSETKKSLEVSIDDAKKSDAKINSKKIKENEETYKVRIADTLENINSSEVIANLVASTIREGERRSDRDSISLVPDRSLISPSELQNAEKEARDESLPLDDKRNCLYLEADNERAIKFSKFLQSFEVEVSEDKMSEQNPSESLEKILESLGGQIVSSLPKTMAPPLITKRKHSTSPLTDILLNNTNNNNNQHKIKESTPEEESNTNKKRKLGRLKKPRAIANVCAVQNLPNGENFVMPLSPESDVSASSEKNLLHLLKEDKSRQRSSQRYSSDDLYKPRPFFSSSSRRSRRSNQA